MGILDVLNCASRLRKRVKYGQTLKPIGEIKKPSKEDVVLFSVVRNEAEFMPYFLEYYLGKGVDKIFIVENNSDDGTLESLSGVKGVNIFQTKDTFIHKEYWMDYLLHKYGTGHWCVIADADEYFIYPHHKTVGLHELCGYLDTEKKTALHCMLVDMYPKKRLHDVTYKSGHDPLEFCGYFDPDSHSTGDNHDVKRNEYPKKMIFGGVRQRVFNISPMLSKISMIKFQRDSYLADGHHFAENIELSELQGAILHYKYFSSFYNKVQEEVLRGQHWNGAIEYKAYLDYIRKKKEIKFYTRKSVKLRSDKDLIKAGIMKSTQDFEEYAKKSTQDSFV